MTGLDGRGPGHLAPADRVRSPALRRAARGGPQGRRRARIRGRWQLSLRSPVDVDPEALASMLRDNGLGLSAIATGQACVMDSLCLGSPDADVRKAAENRLSGAIELAARFEAAAIVGGIRGRLVGSPDGAAGPASRRHGCDAGLRTPGCRGSA